MNRVHPRSFALAVVAAVLVLAGRVEGASACSCIRGTVDSAMAGAALVAELEILEVAPPRDPEDDTGTQLLRARVVRVFATETSVADGDEIVFVHERCNSLPYGRGEVGARFIAFLQRSGGQLTHHHCSFSLSAWEPLPHLLIQARRRWLARR